MTVMYSFFQKPMVNPMTILERSAMPNKTKVATFSSEITRRLRTTSTAVSQAKTEEILMKLMGELEAMGYSLAWKTELLKGAMVGYTRVLGKVSRGETERNRKGAATLTSRRFKKPISNTQWFRSPD